MPKISYLNGQDIGDISKVRYGFRTIGDCGCGPLAVFNAMRFKGLEPDWPKILRYMELTAAPLGALFGTFPFSLGYCMRHFGVKNHMTRSWKKLEAARCGALAYWTKRPIFGGGHFVFYEKREDGTYVVYNRYSNVDHAVEYRSLHEVVKRFCLIVGYVID